MSEQLHFLDNWSFSMNLGGGGDVWALGGHSSAWGHFVYVSSPVEFDEENMIVTVASGKKYQLLNYDGSRYEEDLQEIRDCINRKGYSIH